jgi:CrcB protein
MALWVAAVVLSGAGSVARVTVERAAWRAGMSGLGGTLVVNVSGSLLLGLLTGVGAGGDALLLWGGALLGSFTTFSAWMEGSREVGERQGTAVLARSVAFCLAAGLLAALTGRALAAPFA